jgi:ribonuclease BN (tRNA processing enzyme)
VLLIRANHTSAAELPARATEAQPGLLVLYYQLLRETTDEALVAELKKGYAGEVVSGRDLDAF